MDRGTIIKKMRWAGLSIALILVCAWFYSGALDMKYVANPRHPLLAEGQTVAYAEKGITVYITQEQRRLLSALEYIEIGALAMLVLMFLIFGKAAFANPFNSEADKN